MRNLQGEYPLFAYFLIDTWDDYEHAGQLPAPQACDDSDCFPLSDFASLSSFFGCEVLPLKSVAYQPEPFNWKPAAVNNFLKASFPHWGHTLRIGSETFCRYSLWYPHDPQRYS